MPLYCFTNEETGETIEEFFPMGECPEAIERSENSGDFGIAALVNVYRRDMGEEHSTQRGHRGAEWPIECYASGVHADQANDLRAYFKKKGVSCEVSSDGNPIYTDSTHRKKCLRARNLHDRASFGT